MHFSLKLDRKNIANYHSKVCTFFLPLCATRAGTKCFLPSFVALALSLQPHVIRFLKKPCFHKLKALFPKIEHAIIVIKTSSGSCAGKNRPREV